MALVAFIIIVVLLWLAKIVIDDFAGAPERAEKAAEMRQRLETAGKALVKLGYPKKQSAEAVAYTFDAVVNEYKREPTLNELVSGALRRLKDTS